MHELVIHEYSRPVVKSNHEIVQIFVFMIMAAIVIIAVLHLAVLSSSFKYHPLHHTADESELLESNMDFVGIRSGIFHPMAVAASGQKIAKSRQAAVSQKVKQELVALEQVITDLKLKNIPEIAKFRDILKNDIYAERISTLIKRVSKSDVLLSERSMSKFDGLMQRSDSNFHFYWNSTLEYLNEGLHSLRNYSIQKAPTAVNTSDLVVKVTKDLNSSNLDLCGILPQQLFGAIHVNSTHTENITENEVIEQNADLRMGGSWSPVNCISRHRVAVIIPYRDRKRHLIILLSHLLPILRRQELQFKIFVVEQEGKDTFNKARIMNAAFREAIQQYDFQCVVFHDVDLLPEDDRNMYSCPQQPRHMSVAIDEMGYKVPYDYLVGGVLSMRTDHYQLVNGYSNLYWGWGAEDDDMAFRIMHVGLKITRPPSRIARYKMIKHEKRKPTDWRKRRQLLRSGTRRFNFDGLNSVSYTLVSITERPLYTHILVNIGKAPS